MTANVMLSFVGVYAAGVFRWGAWKAPSTILCRKIFAALVGCVGIPRPPRPQRTSGRSSFISIGVMIVLRLSHSDSRRISFFSLFPTSRNAVAALPVFLTARPLYLAR